MKISELRQKSSDELTLLCKQKRQHIASARFLLKQKKTKNVKEVAALRKDIARILTVLHGNFISHP